jgi:hypothetical protein
MNTLAVTAAFLPASVLVTLALLLSMPASSSAGMAAAEIGWMGVGTTIMVYACIAGLIVDGCRLIARVLWHKKPKHRLRLRKILNQNLA